jgi:aminomethyltransferase
MMQATRKLGRTPLYDLHIELGAKMVPFGGYHMPVQYAGGILAEHRQAREKAALFDVSHMGQAELHGSDHGSDLAAVFERLVPGDIGGLALGRMRYTQLTNDDGGIIDDLMVTRRPGHLFLVVNAGRTDIDYGHILGGIGGAAELTPLDGRALLALQGPRSADVLGRFAAAAATMKFMSLSDAELGGVKCNISRSGYTGEDGFEISAPAEAAADIARMLLAEEEVEAAGLGARDSLRLEAGLCLYGHDIDAATSPVEAGLSWSIGKRRREDGGFPGAAVILGQLRDGPPRKRVGLRLAGRAPAREGAEIVDDGDRVIGAVTSGGFGPTVNGAIAMGYVGAEFAGPGRQLGLIVRGKRLEAEVVKMPFVAHRYFRA